MGLYKAILTLNNYHFVSLQGLDNLQESKRTKRKGRSKTVSTVLAYIPHKKLSSHVFATVVALIGRDGKKHLAACESRMLRCADYVVGHCHWIANQGLSSPGTHLNVKVCLYGP